MSHAQSPLVLSRSNGRIRLGFVACDISVILWSLTPIEATIVAYRCESSDGASQR